MAFQYDASGRARPRLLAATLVAAAAAAARLARQSTADGELHGGLSCTRLKRY